VELAALKSELLLVTVLLLLNQAVHKILSFHSLGREEVSLFTLLLLANAREKGANLLCLANVKARDTLTKAARLHPVAADFNVIGLAPT